jgi:ABC-2 type transport system permease protein
LIQGFLILIISLFLGFRITNLWGIFLALLLMILIGIGFIGFGIAIASTMEDTQGFSTIMNLIVSPLFLLSGAFFPITNLPSWLRPIASINPLTYGVDALRASLIGFSQFSLILDLTVLSFFSLIMVIAGAYFFSKTEI